MLIDRLKKSRVASNATWIIMCKICKAILTLISTMVVSRYLGVEQYGIISYAASLVAFVTPIMKLGINEILVHEIVTFPEKEGDTLGTTIILNICSGVLCAIGLFVFTNIVNGNEKDTIIVCVCYSAMLVFQALEMIYYWFQAKLKSKYTSIAILIAYVIVVCIQIGLVFAKADIYLLAISYSLEYLFIAIILFAFYKREGTYKLSFSIETAKHLLNNGKYYIISGLMVVIFSQTDKIMLKLMCDDAVVGIYSAATNCASMTSFIFVAIIDSLRPSIFESFKNKAQFECKMKSLYSIIIWFSLTQCLAITILAPIIINIIYGSDYIAAVSVLRVVVWFTTFSYLGTVRNIWILSYNYQRYLTMINVSGAIMNIILNILLIPQYGAIGAAIASVIAQFFTNFVIGYIIKPLRVNNKLMLKGLNLKNIFNIVKGD